MSNISNIEKTIKTLLSLGLTSEEAEFMRLHSDRLLFFRFLESNPSEKALVKQIENCREIGAFFEGVALEDWYDPIPFNGGNETVHITTIPRRLQNTDPGLNIDPDYQRDHVWSLEQQENFMGHLLMGGTVPIIIVNQNEKFEHPDEVIDGKQRILAARDFIEGRIGARLKDASGKFKDTLVYWEDFTVLEKRRAKSNSPLTFRYVCLPREEILRLYLKLNRGGTPHTDSEIKRVQELLTTELTS